MPIREWSRNEEVANSLSHGFGFVAALVGAPFLLLSAAQHPGVRPVLGVTIFAVATIFLYLSSAVHHWLLPGKTKDFIELLDHSAIFLMIAGTYTPFATGVLWGPWGWFLLAVNWPLAIFGVLRKIRVGPHPEAWSIILYVVMGWMMIFAFPTLARRMPETGLVFIFAGGLAYTGGLFFYLVRRFPYHHLAWHVCVLIGTAFHYFAILRYAF
ncbi:MAG TPA: hemolysin III family protein [Chthoniobacter sp.]|jgi:hemolysin III